MSKQKVNCAKGTREADLGHAVLSASGSHRWLNCTPSARLELEFENTTSEAAREGTAAHALCEHKLKKFLKKRSKRPVSDYNSDEMEECTDAYRLIRRVSMDQFYAILTGEEDAFYKMCMALPEVINSVVNEEGGVEVPHDTVIDELRKVASLYGDENGELSMAMAVYMLGFNTYMGFGEKICGELGEDRDGMLKRIYEYVRKMQK